MADDLDDGEFWLPSQFLTEEDILTDFGTSSPTTDSGDSVTETESDEDEFFAELTRRMSRSSLVHDSSTPKGLVLSRSPQSTLFPVGGGSSRGSPTGPVSPPPTKEGFFNSSASASFDLLNAAAVEVAKLRLRSDEQPHQKGTGYFDSSRGFLNPPAKPQTSPVPLRPDFHGGFFNQATFQFPQLVSETGDFYHGGRVNTNSHFLNRPLGLAPSAWPPLQRPLHRQPPPPPPTKRESVGTGVFLPRRVNVAPNPNPSPTESRKIRSKNDSTGSLRSQSNGLHGPRRENAQQRANSTEIRLPSEWTY